METRNVKIDLETAREWYQSNNIALQKIALQAFTKEELAFDFKRIVTLKSACSALNLDYENVLLTFSEISEISIASAAIFKLNIIRKALNMYHKLDLVGGQFYIPTNYFTIYAPKYYNKINKDLIIADFKYQNKKWVVISGDAFCETSESLSSNDYDEYPIPGNIGIGFLACATQEIANHFGRYFAKEIFDAKYGDCISYEWHDQFD